jgi:hypothetical protein
MTREQLAQAAREITAAWVKSQPIGTLPGDGTGNDLGEWVIGVLEAVEAVPPLAWPAALEGLRGKFAEALAAEGADAATVSRVLDGVLTGQARENLAVLAAREDPNGAWLRAAAQGLLRCDRAGVQG